ncbi:aminotransferase [Staphylococcus piscifermentans]|uniref:Aminotransferase n=1 Tax=Staphylococcus piscifermentans TaxID=70258 RepID=A0A239U1F2_9STAP|nr:cysteine desulfurase family protein [Staphylococcus piscifermentans]RTX83631.1 cysteine desulfurase [Staphylococcus piscifermentans]GEP84322.1 aminotransferase [Staphylococcus piscifermentans]SNV03248.1 aminotransferase [Staphylococcus piscifermentans]
MIYLDNAATTKPAQDVLDTFVKVNQDLYFNPNSPHQAGLQAEQLLQQAKVQIDRILGLENRYDIIFTSGATESNNMALKGAAYNRKPFADEIIVSVIEHPSVLEVMRHLEEEGFKLKYVNVTTEGKIDLEHLKSLMSSNVGLVTCMQVNNITGQEQPIAEIAQLLKDYPKAHFHVDAVQAIGKVPLTFNRVDSMSFSGHKFNGLKGQGLLLARNIHNLEPVIHGGGQEYGLRSGTVNLPIDIAIVKALKQAVQQRDALNSRLRQYNNDLRAFLQTFRGVKINSPVNSAPHILNVGFDGVKGEVLVNAFSKQNVMLSTTSACSSKRGHLNEVLLSMGVPESQIEGSIRISMGALTSEADIEGFKAAFEKVYEEMKELLKS